MGQGRCEGEMVPEIAISLPTPSTSRHSELDAAQAICPKSGDHR